MSQEARFDSGRFGIVLNNNYLGQIIAITPKSPAAEIGLLSGDKILSVNGISLDEKNDTWQRQLKNQPQNALIKLKVLRKNNIIMLSGNLAAKHIPQWQLVTNVNYSGDAKKISEASFIQNNHNKSIDESCGRVVVGKLLSKQSPTNIQGQMVRAKVISIDGKIMASASGKHYRLKTGPHKIKLGTYLYDGGTSESEFVVEPNTTYYLAFIYNAVWATKDRTKEQMEPYTGGMIIGKKHQQCGSTPNVVTDEETTAKHDNDLIESNYYEIPKNKKDCKDIGRLGTRINHSVCRNVSSLNQKDIGTQKKSIHN